MRVTTDERGSVYLDGALVGHVSDLPPGLSDAWDALTDARLYAEVEVIGRKCRALLLREGEGPSLLLRDSETYRDEEEAEEQAATFRERLGAAGIEVRS